MVHRTNGVNAGDLSTILQDTLKEATPKRDSLTKKIYKYKKDTHKFLCVM